MKYGFCTFEVVHMEYGFYDKFRTISYIFCFSRRKQIAIYINNHTSTMVHDRPLELLEAILCYPVEDIKEDTERARCFGRGHKLWM